MCENHHHDHEFVDQNIKLVDISRAVIEMPAPKGFLLPDEQNGVRPRFAKRFLAMYMIMHWPLINEAECFEDGETGITHTGLSLYAAVMEHGKTHVAEVFFADEKNKSYRGTNKVFAIEFPNNLYDETYDDWLMDEIATRSLGVKEERAIAHNLNF